MSSREKILKAIVQNKPAALPLPSKFLVEQNVESFTENYLQVLSGIGGRGVVIHDLGEVENLLQEKRQSGVDVVNCWEGLSGFNAFDYLQKTNAEVEQLYTAFLKGSIAVAENAAIWVPEKAMVHRLLPFICQELVIVVEEKNIVATMHEAYDRIQVAEDGFGAFIAGPSKTADIEQSLVIGAHGPLSLQVFILR